MQQQCVHSVREAFARHSEAVASIAAAVADHHNGAAPRPGPRHDAKADTGSSTATCSSPFVPADPCVRRLQEEADELFCDFMAKAVQPAAIQELVQARDSSEDQPWQHTTSLAEHWLRALAFSGRNGMARHIAQARLQSPPPRLPRRKQHKAPPTKLTTYGFNSLMFMAVHAGHDPTRWHKVMQQANRLPNTESKLMLLCRSIAQGKVSRFRSMLFAFGSGGSSTDYNGTSSEISNTTDNTTDNTATIESPDELLPLVYCCYDQRDARQAFLIEQFVEQQFGETAAAAHEEARGEEARGEEALRKEEEEEEEEGTEERAQVTATPSFLLSHALMRVYGMCGSAERAKTLVKRLQGSDAWQNRWSTQQKQAILEEQLRAKCRAGAPEEAEADLLLLRVSGLPVTQSMLRILAIGYTARRQLDGVKSVFRRVAMDMPEVLPETATVNQMLASFAVLQDAGSCEKIMQIMGRHGFEPTHETYGLLLEGYARTGGPSAVEERLAQLQREHGLEPHLPELHALMLGHVQARDPEGCEVVFESAVNAGLSLTHRFFCTLARAYALVGDYVQVENVLFKRMAEHGVRMRPAALLHLLDAYHNSNNTAKLMELLRDPTAGHSRRTFQRAVSVLRRSEEGVALLGEVVGLMASKMPLDRLTVKMCVWVLTQRSIPKQERRALFEALMACRPHLTWEQKRKVGSALNVVFDATH